MQEQTSRDVDRPRSTRCTNAMIASLPRLDDAEVTSQRAPANYRQTHSKEDAE